MNVFRRILIRGALAAALAAPFAASADDRASASAALAVVTDFHRALAEGYREGVLKHVAEDAIIFETGYVEVTREVYARGHLDADLLYATTVKRSVVHAEAKAYGDLAYVATQARSEGEFGGEPVALNNTETMVLRREGDTWKIVHIHWSAHDREPAPKAESTPQ